MSEPVFVGIVNLLLFVGTWGLCMLFWRSYRINKKWLREFEHRNDATGGEVSPAAGRGQGESGLSLTHTKFFAPSGRKISDGDLFQQVSLLDETVVSYLTDSTTGEDRRESPRPCRHSIRSRLGH